MTHENRPPLHGDRGTLQLAVHGCPGGMTVAIGRQVGARGGSIAHRLGKMLGWPVYDRDQLELLAADETSRELVYKDLTSEQRSWAKTLLVQLYAQDQVNEHMLPHHLSSMLAGLAAQGGTVIVGRAAGWLLPRATTLHIHIVAPLSARVAHMAEHLRLGFEAAERYVDRQQQSRIAFLAATLHDGPRDEDFDAILNSATLQEEGTARTILQALDIKARLAGVNVPNVVPRN